MVSNKSCQTFDINKLVLEKLKEICPKGKRSAYIDEVLSRKLGISYEEAYPEDKGKRKWIGVFKQ